jgi:hypothetical protein
MPADAEPAIGRGNRERGREGLVAAAAARVGVGQ